MFLSHRKTHPILYSASVVVSGNCPSGKTGGPFSETGVGRSYLSLEDAQELAQADGEAKLAVRIASGCVLLPPNSTDPVWEFDLRTKQCWYDQNEFPYASSRAKKYDVNPSSPTYHNNRPTSETDYYEAEDGQIWFIYTVGDTACEQPYRNALLERSYKRDDATCGTGTEGGLITLRIPYWSFTSMNSQQEADKKASDYLDKWGQQIANGTKTAPFAPFDTVSEPSFIPAACNIVESGTIAPTSAHWSSVSGDFGRASASLQRTSNLNAKAVSGIVGFFNGSGVKVEQRAFYFEAGVNTLEASTTMSRPSGSNYYAQVIAVDTPNYSASSSQVTIEING